VKDVPIASSVIVSCARPPWSKIGRKLEGAFRKALYDYKMLEGVSKVAVALSGGKDSMTLISMLKAVSGRGFPEQEIYAIYVSGEFSCGAGVDEKTLRTFCQELGVNLIVRHSTLKLRDLECYKCSRDRRTLIFEAAKSVGAQTVAFGHHRDDNNQTVLMNIFHKGEFAGILPKLLMHKYGVTIIRPLIYISEDDIKTFAQQHGFAQSCCQCPVGQNSMRKKVDMMLDDIEELFPVARENLSRAVLRYGSDKASHL